jgi:uncharacterized protein YjbJ (UPF0337 family)
MGAADKMKNKAQAAKGQAKEKTGRATGDRRLEGKGNADRMAGNLKQAGENVKDAVRK